MDSVDLLRRSSYFYDLPQELIAQDPLEERSASRLMVLDRNTGETKHRHFYEIGEYLREGDCLVINNTRVIPARLIGKREPGGGACEILLLKRLSDVRWECIVRPGKRLREGARVSFGDGLLEGQISSVLPDGNRHIDFEFEGIFEEILDRLGEMPLPPYITHKLSDRERYQTVYAKFDGSAAAPTAGLHFTDSLLSDLESKGIRRAEVTLHVGLGTFRPVKEDDLRNHIMHTEHYEVTQETADLINRTRQEGGRIISVGTTSTRTLESVTDESGIVHPGSGETDIFIYPGYHFRAIDGLITNFHLPESTLIMLVSAFAGRENVLAAYEEAVRERYRFFSFGDAMLIV